MSPLEIVLSERYPMCQVFHIGEENNVIYDAKANFAFILSNNECNLLARYLSNQGVTEWDNTEISVIDRFRELRDCGVFLAGPADTVSDEDRETIQRKVLYYDQYILQRKFVLEATEDCNFRCKYCPNTINIGSKVRQHTKRKMSIETAKAAIDYYYDQYVKIYRQLSSEKQSLLLETLPPTLSWYGGEPLLNFEVMEQATEYFKQKPWHVIGVKTENLFFSTNSNMSIMSNRILDFLVGNKVQLFASLDGPKEENDKCRVFSDGSGTYDIIVKNLRKIRERDEEYFKQHVSILCVQADDYNSYACEKFFKEGEFSDLMVSSSRQEYVGCTYMDPLAILQSKKDSFENDLSDLIEEIDNAVISDSLSEDVSSLLSYVTIQTDNPKGTNNLGVTLTCPMGIDNNMIGVEGDIHVCHKTDGSAPFANIHHLPVDYSKLVALFVDHNKAVNRGGCRSCWAVRYCSVCGAKRLQQGKFSNPTFDECEVLRLEQKLYMTAFFYAMQNRPDIIDYLENKRNNRHEYISIMDIHTF